MTELQENVIKVLEYKYGWSGMKSDSQMMQELFRDIVNATNDVINKSSDISGIISESDKPVLQGLESDLFKFADDPTRKKPIKERTAVCYNCGSEVTDKNYYNKYCSKECYTKRQTER